MPRPLPLLTVALLAVLTAGDAVRAGSSRPPASGLPSFVLVLSDDQGWGDVGYNGDPVLRTPNLDAMARQGVRFDRFYAAGPLCAPTRAGALTGRYPFRYDVLHSLHAVLPLEEVTVAEVLRERGYATGHFGKWHLGAFDRSNPEWEPAPPWEQGFDVCFSSESSLPTWDPLRDPETGGRWRGGYRTESGRTVRRDLEGDASRVIMDRVVRFLRDSVEEGKPFLAVVWLNAPHHPVVAGGPYRAMYAGAAETEYRGCLTAMDEQVGRLRAELRALGVARNTAVFFASDNGPVTREMGNAEPAGSAGPFRGGKSELLEGGIRVPAVMEWPERTGPRVVTSPWSVLDYLPTLAAAADAPVPEAPLDGASMLPLLAGDAGERGRPIAFRHFLQTAWIDGRYKLLTRNRGSWWTLYDVEADPAEEHDLSREEPDVMIRLRRELEAAEEDWPVVPIPRRD